MLDPTPQENAELEQVKMDESMTAGALARPPRSFPHLLIGIKNQTLRVSVILEQRVGETA